MSRKYVVAALRRCTQCQMLYRTPTDTPAEAESFYNADYVQGLTTSLPAPAELAAMKAAGFAMMESDYAGFAATLKALGAAEGSRVFDYGCSWGYGSWVFAQAGFRVKSHEISRPRRHYGQQHLGIDLAEDFDGFVAANRGSFDVFFSSHVLEHVPSPSVVIAKGFELLRAGGLFVSCFPNGADAWRKASPDSWQKLWGEVHPNLLDDRFMGALLHDRPHLLGVSPFQITPEALDHLAGSAPGAFLLNDLAGYELFVAARKAD
ncbi:MAG TPA: methyltransferase domain-containing protein [Novosphingobium sp.]|nr:methyltransferase domain-containing protein [Novosphingobium sp.]